MKFIAFNTMSLLSDCEKGMKPRYNVPRAVCSSSNLQYGNIQQQEDKASLDPAKEGYCLPGKLQQKGFVKNLVYTSHNH